MFAQSWVHLAAPADARHLFGALQLEIEQRLAAGQHRSHLAFGHLEGTRLQAAPVDDAEHKALAAQATGAARAELRAWSGLQLFAGASHRTGEDRERRGIWRPRLEPVTTFELWPTARRSPRDASVARQS